MFAFLPPGGQFRRTKNRDGLANAGARPISPPSLASSRRERSIPAERKPRRTCPNGMVAQSRRRRRSASLLNEKVQPGEYHRPQRRDGAWFECFELAGVSSGRVTKSRGKLTEAALSTWRLLQFVCSRRYFLHLHGHFCRKNNLGNNAKLAPRADFWSATGPVLCGQLRRENNNDDTAVVATSLT